MIAGIYGDLQHVIRLLSKSRGFVAITLLTLALCLGSNTAIFSVVDALILKPLPFPQPNQIVEIYNVYTRQGNEPTQGNVPQYLDYRENARSIEKIGLWRLDRSVFGAEDAAEHVTGAQATGEIFDVLGIKPEIGRFFTLRNSVPGEDRVIVLTHSFWQTHFGGSSEVLNRPTLIDGKPYIIVGVAPPSFEAFDARVRFVRPVAWGLDQRDPLTRYYAKFWIFARLKPGITLNQAYAEAEVIEKRFYDATPSRRAMVNDSGYRIALGDVQSERAKPLKSSLLLLQAAVAVVLLIGCVNVANLLLVRANGRQTEIAIRFVLGAGRRTIAQQFLIESLLLTGLGAVLGLVLAWTLLAAVNHFIDQLLPEAMPFAIDGRIVGFALLLALASAMFVGILPIAYIWRTNLTEVIQGNTRSISSGARMRRLSTFLTIGQFAVALVLLTGAGLLIRSFAHVLAVDPGLDTQHLLTGRIVLPDTYRDHKATRAMEGRLITAVNEIPGVESVGLAFAAPFQGELPEYGFTLADNIPPSGSSLASAFRIWVSPGYFATLGIRLVAGRFFTSADWAPADWENNHRAVIVDEEFQKKFFPGQSAIGKRFSFIGAPAKNSDWPTIVGVIRNVPQNGAEDRRGIPFVYEATQWWMPNEIQLFVRTPRSVFEATPLIREKLMAIDPAISLFETASLQTIVDGSLNNRRAIMMLLSSLAVLALFLSALGIYGVLAYDVSQRTREVGIRSALGATRNQVIAMILRQGLVKVGVGLIAGLVGATLLSRFMVTLLFEVKPIDPFVYLMVSLLLIGVAMLASYFPACRAAKISPIEALRNE